MPRRLNLEARHAGKPSRGTRRPACWRPRIRRPAPSHLRNPGMYYQRSSAFIGGLQSDRHRSPTTVWPQMNADTRRFARDLLRLSSYFLDTTLVAQSPQGAVAAGALMRRLLSGRMVGDNRPMLSERLVGSGVKLYSFFVRN